MWPEFIAILSATGWAADSILVRKGARTSNVYAAAFISFIITAILLWTIIALFFQLHLLWTPATIYFVLSGLIQPFLTRLLHYIGLTRLGVARSGSLRGAGPFFAVLIAVTFLGERPNLFVYGGTLLTMAGVWFILYRGEGGGEWKLFDVIFPLGSSFVAAISQNLRKMGLLLLPNPFVGGAITTTTSLTLYLISICVTGKFRLVRPDRASLAYFVPSAFVAAAAQFLVFLALTRGDVSTIVPLINTTPFFTVLFSAIFLRDLEHVTSKLFFGSILLVTGVVLITIR
jgi:drug/metabolite transporter (DMT)-like permease